MARAGDDDLGVDGVGVHARLVVVVHGHQGPVGHDPGHSDLAVVRWAGDQVLHTGGVEELDVGELEHLGAQLGDEERCVLDDNEVVFLLVLDAELPDELVGRLSQHHGREQLAAKEAATADGHVGLDDGDLEVRSGPGEDVCCREAGRAGAHNDNVGLGVRVEVLEVSAGHGPRDLGLSDGLELERVPVVDGCGGLGDLGVCVGHVERLQGDWGGFPSDGVGSSGGGPVVRKEKRMLVSSNGSSG